MAEMTEEIKSYSINKNLDPSLYMSVVIPLNNCTEYINETSH